MSMIARQSAIFPLVMGVLFAFTLGAGTAVAAQHGPYYTDGSGNVWKSAEGECWYNPNLTGGEPREECGDEIESEPETVQAQQQPQIMTTTERVAVDARTLFGFDKAVLTQTGKDELRALAAHIDADWDIQRLRVIGHTDRIGPEAYNQQLSERRAQAVADFLKTLPLSQYPMLVVGVGEGEPVVQCENTGGRDALIECLRPNRRVEVEVTGTKTVTEVVE